MRIFTPWNSMFFAKKWGFGLNLLLVLNLFNFFLRFRDGLLRIRACIRQIGSQTLYTVGEGTRDLNKPVCNRDCNNVTVSSRNRWRRASGCTPWTGCKPSCEGVHPDARLHCMITISIDYLEVYVSQYLQVCDLLFFSSRSTRTPGNQITLDMLSLSSPRNIGFQMRRMLGLATSTAPLCTTSSCMGAR